MDVATSVIRSDDLNVFFFAKKVFDCNQRKLGAIRATNIKIKNLGSPKAKVSSRKFTSQVRNLY